MKRVGAAAFDRIYAKDPDPWQLESSAYERGKYAETLRAVEDADCRRALEIGCAKGAFTVQLARLCDCLVAIDFSGRATAAARRRVARQDGVTVLRRAFPEQVPDGPWTLIVCSEVLYYLDPPALDQAIAWFSVALGNGSSVVVVHWRGPGVTEPLRGDDVHDRLAVELRAWHLFDRRSEHYRLDRFGSRALAPSKRRAGRRLPGPQAGNQSQTQFGGHDGNNHESDGGNTCAGDGGGA